MSIISNKTAIETLNNRMKNLIIDKKIKERELILEQDYEEKEIIQGIIFTIEDKIEECKREINYIMQDWEEGIS